MLTTGVLGFTYLSYHADSDNREMLIKRPDTELDDRTKERLSKTLGWASYGILVQAAIVMRYRHSFSRFCDIHPIVYFLGAIVCCTASD